MTRILIYHFSELVKGHVQITMPVSHGTDLRVGPTTLEECLLGDFESSYSLSSNFEISTALCDFEDKNDMLSPSFTYASPHETSTSLSTFEDVLIIPNPFLPLAPLGELEEENGFETSASSDD